MTLTFDPCISTLVRLLLIISAFGGIAHSNKNNIQCNCQEKHSFYLKCTRNRLAVVLRSDPFWDLTAPHTLWLDLTFKGLGRGKERGNEKLEEELGEKEREGRKGQRGQGNRILAAPLADRDGQQVKGPNRTAAVYDAKWRTDQR